MNLYDELMEMVIIEDTIEEYKNRRLLDESKIEDTVEKMLDKYYNLAHYKLTREDLSNPAKVKDAIKNMNLESPRNAKKRALPALIISMITYITSTVLFTKYDDKEFEKDRAGWNASVNARHNAFENHFRDPNTLNKVGEEAAKKATEQFKDNNKLLAGALVCLAIGIATFAAGFIGSINDYDRMISACDHSVKKLRKELDKEKKKSDPDKNRIKEIEKTISKINETQNMIIIKKKNETSTTVRNI